MRSFILLFSILLFFTACESSSEPFPPPIENGDEDPIVNAFPKLSFTRPLDIQNAGDGSDRLFVVEQEGLISVFPNDPEVEVVTVFLDIHEKVNDSANEQGLLGLAFHPDFENNGYFYVNYTASGPDRTVISRFKVSADDPDVSDPDSEVEMLSYRQPHGNHNGGHLAFGPDGYLYIASGDGGGAGDPENNGQDKTSLLGAILRIDVDQPKDGNQYRIPVDNPFAVNQEGFREEIFAYGLRNPWRFSFDTETGQMWAGDVGQSRREIIHTIDSGLNYGWNIIEGSICYPQGASCDTKDLEMPVYEYNHNQGDRSITGGFIYRGENIPQLEGLYIYGDFVSGRIWALDVSDPDNPVNSELFHAGFNIPSFGVDEQKEIYVAGFDGNIYRLGNGIVDAL